MTRSLYMGRNRLGMPQRGGTIAEILERGIRPVRPVTGIVDDEGVNRVGVFQGFTLISLRGGDDLPDAG